MGLTIKPVFVKEGRTWTEDLKTVMVDAVIRDASGKEIFNKHIESLEGWSDTANAIVASKYMLQNESRITEMIQRIVSNIVNWGLIDGYFDMENAAIFSSELGYILSHQMASFNSPVWFNIGKTEKPTTSACFINSVEDTMESILEWYKTEGLIFRDGSGAGVNISSLRSSKEFLSNGGRPSGPISFMKAADASAGVIKSGGKVRRAAKMVILDDTHPDILEFIQCKVKEEKKARVLMDAGFDNAIDGDAYSTVAFQNSNHAVSLGNEFMDAYKRNDVYYTKKITDGKNYDELPARKIMRRIAEAAHDCGDPGVIFRDTVNKWNPIPNTGPIRASNPCAEYFNVDNSACNLASIRLTAFMREDTSFDYESFARVVEIMIIAQDILIDRSSYPTPQIEENSKALRALGLGYTDLGALLMSKGMVYDSDEGRELASEITSYMTAIAFRASVEMAKVLGPFKEFEENKNSMLGILKAHEEKGYMPISWDEIIGKAELYGVRNCMTTLLAPTGTISLMMDCITTGIEPELSLVKYKTMVGGGHVKMVNVRVIYALSTLGYSSEEIKGFHSYLLDKGCLEGAQGIAAAHLPVFDCALKPEQGNRFLSPEAHLKMMAAVQPFLSGAISKTVNLPCETTVEEIEGYIYRSFELGLKAVTFYRDNCKSSQPLSVTKEVLKPESGPVRRKMNTDSKSLRHKFSVGGFEGYIHSGLYSDGSIGEVFVKIAKEGSTIAGLLDTISILTSFALQYGVPLQDLVRKLSHVRFEPSGFSKNPNIPIAKSLVDYVFRYLGHTFLTGETQQDIGMVEGKIQAKSDAPVCQTCGHLMVRSGHCYCCLSCGATSGCS